MKIRITIGWLLALFGVFGLVITIGLAANWTLAGCLAAVIAILVGGSLLE